MLKASFKIVSGNAFWGRISGNIQNQTDLVDFVDTKISALGGDIEQELTALEDEVNSLSDRVSDNYTDLNGKISTNATNLSNHIADKTNPHEVTKAQVGLGNVDNTSDLNKPISTATQTALDGKIDKLSTKPTAGVYTKVTITNEGLASDGTTLSEADIPSLHLVKISDVTSTAAEVNQLHGSGAVQSDFIKLHGITSIAAELNILDGATLTTTELNYVDGVTSPIQTQISANATNISNIQVLIPSEATTTNQLADKEFVNSSISTNTANFIGTFASVSLLEAYTGTVTNNDYAFVVNSVITDNGDDWATYNALNAYDKSLLTNFDYAWVINGSNFDLYRFDILNQQWDLRVSNTPKTGVTLNVAYNRYKATVSGSTVTWDFEYTLNNSSFTASQWAAINSGATTTNIGQISTNTNDISTINTTIGSYGDIVTYNASAFATAAQGSKADTAVQSITTGSANGTISVDSTDVSVYGLGSAAYTNSTAYATLAQGTKADSAIQGVTLNGSAVTPDANKVVALANMQTTTNLVTSVSSASTDAQYPSAKLFYDTCGDIETLINAL